MTQDILYAMAQVTWLVRKDPKINTNMCALQGLPSLKTGRTRNSLKNGPTLEPAVSLSIHLIFGILASIYFAVIYT